MCETLQFLDCICGSTTGGLGLLGLYINENNVGLVRQTLETITEYSQGPCHENQVGGGSVSLQLTVLLTCFGLIWGAFTLTMPFYPLISPELHSQAWVKRHWYNYSSDCELHQPPGEASTGPCAWAQGEQQVTRCDARGLESLYCRQAVCFYTRNDRIAQQTWHKMTGGGLTSFPVIFKKKGRKMSKRVMF